MIDLTQTLTQDELKLHRLAQARCRGRNRIDWEIIEILQKVHRQGFYKKLGRNSLFSYANLDLDLTRSVANCFDSVARTALEFPVLQEALRELKITVSIAQRMVAAMTEENADRLVEFATTHSKNETEREMDRIRRKDGIERMVKVEMPASVYEKLRRANSVRAQKGHTEKLFETAGVVADEYLGRHDPVKKAERAAERAQKRANRKRDQETGNPLKSAEKPVCPGKVASAGEANQPASHTKYKRKPKTAKQTHTVNLRDQGQCTFIDAQGNRCPNDRYVQHHHIVEVHNGGTNEPENLTTLCSIHHDLVHQLSLPIDGQINWLRSRVAEYGQFSLQKSEYMEFV